MNLPKEINFLIYNLPDEQGEVLAIVKDESIWTTQEGMAKLFDCSSDNISLHLKNIYKEQELKEEATAEDFSVVQTEGNRQARQNWNMVNLTKRKKSILISIN